jgi:uncharacterized protein
MPHRCVRCGTFYEDASHEILKGCKCGSKLFFYVKKKAQAQEIIENLTAHEKKQIEKDIYEIIGEEKREEEVPIVLDIESVRITKPGKFELDLVNLFNKKHPLVYKLEEGRYVIDLAETFLREKEDK